MFCETDAESLMERFAGREVRWRISDTAIEFRATPLDVVKAELITEQILNCCGTVSIYDFITHLGIDEDLISIPIDSGVPDLTAGWCSECFVDYDSDWLDFIHTVTEDEEGLVFVICFGMPFCYKTETCSGAYNCERGSYEL